MENDFLTWIMAHRQFVDRLTQIVTVFSILHNVLPPWDWRPEFIEKGLVEFPAAQQFFYASFKNRYYRLVVFVVGYLALNGRSTVWKWISVNNQDGPNANPPIVVSPVVVVAGQLLPPPPKGNGKV